MLLTEALFDPSVLALGEAGLDKQIETPMPLQIEVFEAQARLAEEFGKPMVIHCVKAWEELLGIRKLLKPQMPWVIHGFRGNADLARQLIQKGIKLSFGQRYNPEALRMAGADYIFAETDDAEVSIEEIYAGMAKELDLSIDLLALTLRKNVSETFSV